MKTEDTRRVFVVTVNVNADVFVLAENAQEAEDIAADNLERVEAYQCPDLLVDLAPDKLTRFPKGWSHDSLVFHTGTDDVKLSDAMEIHFFNRTDTRQLDFFRKEDKV